MKKQNRSIFYMAKWGVAIFLSLFGLAAIINGLRSLTWMLALSGLAFFLAGACLVIPLGKIRPSTQLIARMLGFVLLTGIGIAILVRVV